MRPARSARLAASLLLILLSVIVAHAQTPLDAATMDAQVRIENTVTFAPAGEDYRVESATGTLVWYPRDSPLLEVRDLSIAPDPTNVVGSDTLRFTWTRPAQQETIIVRSSVRTRNAVVPVRSRIPLPLQDIPPELDRYLAFGEFTDSSESIQRQAQALAAGKTDAYEVSFVLADWTTRNVEYSLESLRAPAIQRSSQVMATRYGKCDEITALFISMNRAVGIPARFVAGYSYSDSERFAQPWGGHGWAEVWFPDVGWVPFDVTYGEYGYLDAGHVPFATFPDAQETSVSYQARGTDFTLQTSPLNITITPTNLGHDVEPVLELSLDAPRSRVGFGSAVLILATVTNTRDYYVSTRLDLAETKDTDRLSDTYANVLLRPRESRTIPFLVRIDEDLASGYRYEFPFVLHARLGAEAETSVSVTQDGPVYTEGDFADALNGHTKPTGDLSVTCDRGDTRYVGETVTHTCSVLGPIVTQIDVCPKGSACDTRTVTGGAFDLSVTPHDAGTRTVAYTARAAGQETQFYLTTRAVAPTDLTISPDAPPEVTPEEVFGIDVQLSYDGATPMNVSVTLDAVRETSTQSVDFLHDPTKIRFDVPARLLRPGENTIVVTVEFVDELGTVRTETQSVTVSLVDVNAWDRIVSWLTGVQYWFEGLF